MDLPNDILLSIFSVLPIKVVLRLMCVSKSWNSLISSSTFIAAHHKYHEVNNPSENDKESSYLLYMRDDNCRKSSQVCTMLRESDDAPPSYVKHCDLVLPLSRYYVVGVCEGLICMTDKSHNANHIYLWNPFVGTLKSVPPRGRHMSMYNRVVVGFGFANDDYKIVNLIYQKRCLYEVEIYSLGTNSWRRIKYELSKWWIDYSSTGVFLEGSIYWLSQREYEYGAPYNRTDYSIMRFDLEEEKLVVGMRAPRLNEHYGTRKGLVVSNGFLVLLEVKGQWGGVPVQAYVKQGSSWISTIQLFEDTYHLPSIKLAKSGHLNLAAIKDGKVFTYDYNRVNGWKFREMKISRTLAFDLVRVKETLVLLNEQHKNG